MAGRILGTVPTFQSIALAADNVAFVKDMDKDAGDFVGQATKNIVGASLIGETANIIGSI